MSKKFEGKVAIVTGSSSGIGRAVLLGLAKEGASVVIHGTNDERIQNTVTSLKELNISESKYLTIKGEIQLESVQKEIIQKTLDKFGQIDILINNAGVVGKPGVPEDAPEVFDFIMNVNFRAPYMLTQLALPHLQKTKGNVINTSSVASFMKPSSSIMMSLYGSSKSALDTWVKFDAQRMAGLGVRINNINPGPFLTNIITKNLPEMSEEQKDKFKELTDKAILSQTAMKRWGELDEIVPAFLLLADNKQSSFTTGACWVVDGGMSYCAPDVKFN